LTLFPLSITLCGEGKGLKIKNMIDPLTTQDITLYDENGNPISVILDGSIRRVATDSKINGTIVAINEDTNFINNGNGFIVTTPSVLSLAKTSSYDVLIITSVTKTLNIRDISCNVNKNTSTGTVVFQLFGGVTVSANGNALTPINTNRGSAITADFSAYYTPTITTTGTKLIEYLVHSDWETYVAPSYTTPFKFILKQNEKYLFRLQNNLQQAIDFTEFLFFTEY
jgi:hypothetical protein